MRLAIYIFVVGTAVATLGVLLKNPFSFQKSNSIRVRSDPIPDLLPGSFDVAPFLASIPYQEAGQPVYQVYPRAKYEATIEEGRGNCSNLSFGAAYLLDQQGLDFQIVHLMPWDGFLGGGGHTVLRMGYVLNGESRVGIVDMLMGGVPTSDGTPLDVEMLAKGPITDFHLVRLNVNNVTEVQNFGDVLSRSDVGIVLKPDIVRYFRFIESIYVPLGNHRVEKYIYDGLALMLGVYPRVWVQSLEHLFEGHQTERRLMILNLWTLRLGALALLAMLITDFVRLVRRRPKQRLSPPAA